MSRHDIYDARERWLMQAGAIQAYDRALAIVSLRGRAREAVETQKDDLIQEVLIFDGNGMLTVSAAARETRSARANCG